MGSLARWPSPEESLGGGSERVHAAGQAPDRLVPSDLRGRSMPEAAPRQRRDEDVHYRGGGEDQFVWLLCRCPSLSLQRRFLATKDR